MTKNEEFKSALTVNACTWLGTKNAQLVVTWFKTMQNYAKLCIPGVQKYKEVNMPAIGPKSGVHVHSFFLILLSNSKSTKYISGS